MNFEELKKGNAVSLEVKPRFKQEVGTVKGIVLDITETRIVIKPIVFDSHIIDQFTKASIHSVFEYTKNEIVSISRTRFPKEVSAAFKTYVKQHQEEMKIKQQIQALHRQLHTNEKEKEETFEHVTKLYFKETKTPETSFVSLYLEEQLKKEIDAIIEQKDEEYMTVSLGRIKEVGKEVEIFLFLHRSYPEIPEVRRCNCHYECECNTNLNEEALFKKYGKRFSLDALQDFTIQQSKEMEIGDKACVTFMDQLQLRFNPTHLEPTKALETIVSFMKQYA